VLEAMKLDNGSDTRRWTTGTSDTATWVVVDDPDPASDASPSGTRYQAAAKGAALITRGEGAWFGNGVVYVVASNGGPLGLGQVFAYDPVGATFTCVIASTGAHQLAAPDNVCVSPRGGIVLCEDGSGLEHLHGLTPTGQIFRFAQNNVVLPSDVMAARRYTGSGDSKGSEWAGATFEPENGNWMFANLQDPGITVAITGQWRRGALELRESQAATALRRVGGGRRRPRAEESPERFADPDAARRRLPGAGGDGSVDTVVGVSHGCWGRCDVPR